MIRFIRRLFRRTTIRTRYDPALPTRPWIAWEDGREDGDDPRGRGDSKAEAIADLKAWIAAEMEDEE